MDSEKDIKPSQPAVEDSEEEENEILEESPCGRWLKRREEVEQSNIPGIDATYLAMDTEEGVEVVWNEVRFSERKYFKAKEEIISDVFDRLIQLEHPNIVKLHKYWIHKDADMPRVIFITEYMSSGSLKQFLRKTKRHDIKMGLQAWRRWCTQTLSALCYLHSSQPPIIHGNINCDTIFISYNGLIKIGAIAPDAIHRHVKTVRADSKSNLHFIAPEMGIDQNSSVLSPAVDIYSFGMCALEMAALEISTDDDEVSHHITGDVIQKTIDALENPLQKNFIQQCLQRDANNRPSARDLLFHPIIFEVPALRLYCAHSILNNPSLQPEQLTEDAISRFLCLQNQSDRPVVEIRYADRPARVYRQSDFPNRELEKFLDEVKNGACPLTAIMTTTRPPLVSKQRTISPEIIDDQHKVINTPDNPYDEETRRIVHINCCVQPVSVDPLSFDVKIIIKLDDKINRQLTCEIINDQFIPSSIAQELVYFGFINKDDMDIVAGILFDTFNESQLYPNHVTSCEKSFEIQKCNNQIAPPMLQQPTILVSEPAMKIPSNQLDYQIQDLVLVPVQIEPEDLSFQPVDHNVIYNTTTTTTTTGTSCIISEPNVMNISNDVNLPQSSDLPPTQPPPTTMVANHSQLNYGGNNFAEQQQQQQHPGYQNEKALISLMDLNEQIEPVNYGDRPMSYVTNDLPQTNAPLHAVVNTTTTNNNNNNNHNHEHTNS